MESRLTLGRNERLKKRKVIEEIFKSGEAFSVYPFRVYYLIRHDSDIDDGAPDWNERINEPILQFGVAVSKKNFKKAVDRNRIKRLIREAYRLQQVELRAAVHQKKELCLKLFIVYNGKEMPDYSLIEDKVGKILLKLQVKFDSLR